MAVAGFAPRTLELKDGTKVHVRPIEPSDEPLLHEAVAAMSERTVYFRFFTPLKRMPDALAHRLAVVDYHDHDACLSAARSVSYSSSTLPSGVTFTLPTTWHAEPYAIE